MIRTLNDILQKRTELTESIRLLELKMHSVRDEIANLRAKGESAVELYKEVNAIIHSLTRLRGAKETLDYMVNYDSNLNTDAVYYFEKEKYQLK